MDGEPKGQNASWEHIQSHTGPKAWTKSRLTLQVNPGFPEGAESAANHKPCTDAHVITEDQTIILQKYEEFKHIIQDKSNTRQNQDSPEVSWII